jgi:hypothetical protein
MFAVPATVVEMSRVRLGELLMSRGWCTREQLSAAWEQKVLFGDRLGTNLLAAGAVDEHTLVLALGEQHHVHGVHGGGLRIDPLAVSLVPARVAVKRQMLPHHVVDGTLYLLMVDPTNLRALDEARSASLLKVRPVVVCEARMWSLLALHHGARTPMRPNPLDTAHRPRSSSSSQATLSAVPLSALPLPSQQEGMPLGVSSPAAPVEDLVSEADFHELYARLAKSPVNLGFGDPGLVEVVADDVDDRDLPALLPLPAEGVAWDAPALVARVQALGLPEIDVDEVIDHVLEAVEPVVEPAAGEFFNIPKTQEFQPPDRTPLSFCEAVELLKGATSRDDIGNIVLRAAHQQFARAALLTVYPQAFVGWQGVGEAFDTIEHVVVPRDVQSVFQLVADTRAHYLGPLQRFPAHGAWVKATGRRLPRSLLVVPVLVRGRAVNLLVADNGHEQHASVDVGELLILAQHIAASYEGLINKG